LNPGQSAATGRPSGASVDDDERPIIVTKVRPPRRRRDLVSRPRLIDYLIANADRKLMLVSAPPGYGKTTLLVDFLHESALASCWYRLDDTDTDLPVFFEHLVASLRQRYPGVAERTLSMVHSEPRADPETLVGSLINEISEEIDEFFLLVLDDYHKLDHAPLINAAVDFFLKYLPDNCRVVVCSRTLPKQLTLTRLAAEGQVVGVGQEHLRFRPAEILDLVRHLHSESLSIAEAQALAARSEGWIAALVMGSVRLLDGVRTGLDLPVADHGQLFDFLAEEVLDQQTERIRGFLLETAILDAMSPELCDIVRQTDDSDALLAELEEMNLFLLPLEGEGRWYRYHQLFHEFLQARVRELADPQMAARHRRAATWYAEHGQVDHEIAHLIGAGDAEAAADRMEAEVTRSHDHGRWHTIVRWMDALPKSVQAERPALQRALGVAHAYLGNMADSIASLGSAIKYYTEADDRENLAASLVSRSYTWRYMGHIDASLADAAKSLDLTQNPSGRVASSAHRSLGACYSLKGDVRAGAEELLRALTGFEAQGETASAALTHSDLSAMYQIVGDLERSLAHAAEARRTWESLGSLGNLSLALNNMGTAYHAQGRFNEALDLLGEATSIARQAGDRRTEALALVGQADVESDLGEFAAAIDHYEHGLRLARGVGQGALVAYGLASLAEAQRLTGDIPAAQATLAQAGAEPTTHRSAYEGALVHYVQGTVALDLGDLERAAAHLEDAARSFGAIGALREMARAELALCAAWHRSGDSAAADRWWKRSLATIERFGHRDAFAPQVGRLPDVFARDRIRPVDDGKGPAFSTGAVEPQPDRPRRVRPKPSGDPATSLTVRAFGQVEIRRDGELIEPKAWQSATAREIFLYLIDRPEGASRDDMFLAFWPESSVARATSSFHTTMHRMRQVIGKDSVRHEGDRYRLAEPSIVDYDVRRFEDLVARSRTTADASEAMNALEEALTLVNGAYMAGADHTWVTERAESLMQTAIDSGMRLAALKRASGDPAGAAMAFRRVVDLDPLREDVHRALIKAYVEAGDRARALKHFERLVDTLERELGVQPDAATVALVEAIRAKDELPAG
jgi:LuxR family transcriptional regulator, maltose regulon positive regulatory protein